MVDKVRQYCYDKNGNRVARCDATDRLAAHTYDYANRLKSFVSLTNGLVTASHTYGYAPTGERTLKTNQLAASTTAFMYDGADVVTDYAVPAAGTYAALNAYVQGLRVDNKIAHVTPGGETVFYNEDAIGTVHQLVSTPPPNTDAAVLDTQLTTAWGEDLLGASQATRYHFAQREREAESDLVYMRARHYDPGLGRFIQMEPIFGNQVLEHYVYGRNNPLIYRDPMGLEVTQQDRDFFTNYYRLLANAKADGNVDGYFQIRTILEREAGALVKRQGWYEWGATREASGILQGVLATPAWLARPDNAQLNESVAVGQANGKIMQEKVESLATQETTLEWIDTGATVITTASGVGATISLVRTVGVKVAVKHLGKEYLVDLAKDQLIGEALDAAGVPPEVAAAFQAAAMAKSLARPKGAGATPKGQTDVPGAACPVACFVAGTPVWTGGNGSTPIEQLKVGDRVRTPEDGGGAAETAVEPATWKRVRLYMPNPTGEGALTVELLRPAEWVARTGAEPGAEVHLSIDEIGIGGVALVDAVEACPPIQPGPGRVVLATVTHEVEEIYELTIEGLEEPLRLTGNHNLYSESRDGWIAAMLLVPGELVHARDGAYRVLAVKRIDGRARVFNIEVEAERCYFVWPNYILSHNACPKGGRGPVNKGKAGEAMSEAEAISAGETIRGKQPTLELPSGRRTRPDTLTETPGGQVKVREAKHGPGAHLTPGQRELQGVIEQGGTVIPRGGRARQAGLIPGQPTQLDLFEEDRY